MKRFILEHAAFNNEFLQMVVGDIPEERMCEQPGGVTNHPAWVLGHLAVEREYLGPFFGLAPKFGDDWMAKFGFGSAPTTDRAAYPSKTELVEAATNAREELISAVRDVPDARLTEPIEDEQLKAHFPTVGRFATHVLVWEPAFHLGQVSAWRRALGLPSVIG